VTFAIGIDIGGTGIKGGRVDVSTGELVSDRVKYPTPAGGRPDDILAVVRTLLADLGGGHEPLGVCFPAVISGGRTMSAANVSDEWIGLPAERLFSDALGRRAHFVNDADAAGLAEARYGAAAGVPGLVVVITLGTGIGSALIHDGVLIPNAELGHLDIDGDEAESKASSVAREREGLTFAQWGVRLTRYFSHLERLFSPSLFVIGGGVSKQSDEFFPFIDIKTPIVPARMRNNAGIAGAAYFASGRESGTTEG